MDLAALADVDASPTAVGATATPRAWLEASLVAPRALREVTWRDRPACRGEAPVDIGVFACAAVDGSPAAGAAEATAEVAVAGEALLEGVAVAGVALAALVELPVAGAVSLAVEVVVEVPDGTPLAGSGFLACLAAPAAPRELCEEPAPSELACSWLCPCETRFPLP